LLEMLGAEEHALRPDDLVIPGHVLTHNGTQERPLPAAPDR
jgi:hypothetical protein